MFKQPRNVAVNTNIYGLPFAQTHYYQNSTSEAITVIGRDGVPITFAPHSAGYCGADIFSIRVLWRIRGQETLISIINNLHKHMERYAPTESEITLLKDILLNNYTASQNRINSTVVEVEFEYSYTLAEIKEKENLYCQATDKYICRGLYHNDLLHPFSREGVAFGNSDPRILQRKISGLTVEIIDNESEINQRFLFAGKQVISVPVKRDMNLASGVYYCIGEGLNQEKFHLTSKFCSFAEAESILGLYASREAAATGGHPELLAKQHILGLEKEIGQARAETNLVKEQARQEEIKRAAELAQLQHELASAKAKRDLEIAERDHTLETLKKDNAVLKERLERRSQERADHYESRSYERKDNSEMAKYIPAMVVAVAAGVAYFMKS